MLPSFSEFLLRVVVVILRMLIFVASGLLLRMNTYVLYLRILLNERLQKQLSYTD